MTSTASTATIDTLDAGGSFSAYVARPGGDARAAVVVIQEIFGVNAGIRAKCDKLADAGYLAVAPDLFWRLEPEVELDPDVKAQFDRAIALMQRFDEQLGVRDLEATIRFARRELGGGDARVGCVGYCLGGRMAFLAACRTDVDASVGYYGVGIDGLLREAHAIANPVLLHVPTADHFVGADAQRAMHEGLDPHPKVTIHDYEGLDHGFATEAGERRDEEGAALADRRTAEFFAQHLG